MTWPTPFTTHRTIKVGATETHVAELGSGDPVVLLHGNPDTHLVWATVASRLPNVRVIAPDLPGFGKSRAPDDFDVSLDAQAEYIRELLSALELDRVHLVIHDVGGVYGLAFATLHPQRLQTLTVFNTVFAADYKWHFWGRVWRTRVLGNIAQAIANRPLFVRELRRGSPTMPREYAEHAYGEFHADAKRMVLRYYRASDPENWAGWDKRILETTSTVPTQVLWGDKDPFIQPRFGDRFGGKVHHVDHGHWMMLEDPDFAANAIGALVASNPLR